MSKFEEITKLLIDKAVDATADAARLKEYNKHLLNDRDEAFRQRDRAKRDEVNAANSLRDLERRLQGYINQLAAVSKNRDEIREAIISAEKALNSVVDRYREGIPLRNMDDEIVSTMTALRVFAINGTGPRTHKGPAVETPVMHDEAAVDALAASVAKE